MGNPGSAGRGRWRVRVLMLLLMLAWLPSGLASPVGPWDPLAAWHRVELNWVAQFQSVPGLEPLMRMLTELGPGRPMALVLGVFYLVWDPRRTARLLVLLLLVLWLRELLALAFESPRPFWYGDPIRASSDMAVIRTTYSFPSGHALAGTALWWTVAALVARPWAWGVAAMAIVGIGLSRVYLGVHYPSDVVAGTLVGAACAWGFPHGEAWWGRHWTRWSVGQRRAMVAGLVMAGLMAGAVLRGIIGPVPEDAPAAWGAYFESARSWRNQARLAGTLLGMGWAVAAMSAWPQVVGTPGQRAWRVVWAGVAGAALLLGLAKVRAMGGGTGTSGVWGTVLQFAVAAIAGWGAVGGVSRALVRWRWWAREAE